MFREIHKPQKLHLVGQMEEQELNLAFSFSYRIVSLWTINQNLFLPIIIITD